LPREITAFSNPLIKRIRSLREKRHRRDEGLFLAEGLRILTEADEAGHLPLYLFYSKDSADHPLVQRLTERIEAGGEGEVILTSRDILQKLSGKDNPQTVIGVYPDLACALDQIDRHTAPLWMVAQSLRDPGNLGTILRTGDATGAGGLILIDDCVDPFSVESVRASMGALFTQKIVQTRWEDFIPWLRAGPGMLIGTSLNTDFDYQQPRYTPPSFLLVGNESRGLPEEYEQQCDVLVKIPMLGKADSLNAAVATAVMAYEIINQWRHQG
jgi:TrmH family RNA methyltransferase